MSTVLEIDRILQILPHRWPFVMVDRVNEFHPKERIFGYKLVSASEIWCQGHFPGRPIMPGVLVIESLMQLAALLAYASDPFDVSTSLMYFLGIEKAKFRRPVIPGDKLDLEVNVIQQRTNVWKFRGEACVDGSTAATAEFIASVVDREA